MVPAMLRVSVLAVLVGFVGTPLIGVGCELWCHTMDHAMDHHMAMGHDGHHQSPRVEGDHGCVHEPGAMDGFVPTSGSRSLPVPTPSQVAAAMTSEAVDGTCLAVSAHDRSPPGHGVVARLVRTSVLRL